jgi:hypothetical protein
MSLRNNTIHYKHDPDRFNNLIHYRDDLKGMSLKRKIENFNGTRNNHANRINLSRGNSGSDNKKSQRHKRLRQEPTPNNQRKLFKNMEKSDKKITKNVADLITKRSLMDTDYFYGEPANIHNIRVGHKFGNFGNFGGASTRKNRKKRKTRKRKQKN